MDKLDLILIGVIACLVLLMLHYLVANTARTAIRLAPSVAYPSLDFDWAVINFRPGHDRWTQGMLTALPDCPWCAR